MLRTFILNMHTDYGMLGWTPTWIPDADPLTSPAIGHDCLEHIGHEANPLSDELIALGAVTVLRGRTGWFGRQGRQADTVYKNLPSDFIEFARKMAMGENVLEACAPTRPLDDKAEDRALFEAVVEGFGLAHDELDEIEEWATEPAQMELIRQPTLAANMAIGWMRKGVRLAQRRYGHIPHAACETFDLINTMATRAMNMADHVEGTRLRLRISPQDVCVSMSLFHPSGFRLD